MTIWIVNGSEKKRLIQCKRNDIINRGYDSDIGSRLCYAISSIYDNEISYGSTYFKDDASEDEITCGKYDFFECQQIELKFSDDEYYKIGTGQNQLGEYVNALNYISKSVGKDLLCIYTENTFGMYISFYREHGLKRKHKIFGIVKDSVKFIPNKNSNVPVITKTHNHKTFKEFIAPILLSDLNSFNMVYHSDVSRFKFENENFIKIYVGNGNDWQREIQKAIIECLPMIKEKLFAGKFKKFCEDYNVTDISLLKNIVGEDRDLEFDISNLGKEKENES